MLTIKSDDVVGRAKAFESIVKGIDIPASNVPESFKVLVKELQALGLSVKPTGAVTAKQLPPEETKVQDITVDAKELAEVAGAELVDEEEKETEEKTEPVEESKTE